MSSGNPYDAKLKELDDQRQKFEEAKKYIIKEIQRQLQSIGYHFYKKKSKINSIPDGFNISDIYSLRRAVRHIDSKKEKLKDINDEIDKITFSYNKIKEKRDELEYLKCGDVNFAGDANE